MGQHQTTARPIGFRIPATESAAAIERLLRRYLETRRGVDESFRAFSARHTDAELREMLAGEVLAPVERDPVTGAVPHGVDH